MADDRRRQSAWRTGNPRPAAEPGPKRRGAGKRFVVLALILTIVGVIAALAYYWRRPPQPLFLGLAVTQYIDRSYPPNPWAQQDSDGLRNHFESDSARAVQAQDKKGLIDQLTSLAQPTGGIRGRKRPVVVHLCAHTQTRDGYAYRQTMQAGPLAPR